MTEGHPGDGTPEVLCRQYHPFLCKMAGQVRQRFGSVDEADLLQEGRLALIQAARRYDPARRASFLGWIEAPVRWAMQRFARRAARAVRVPHNRFNRVSCTMVSLDQPAAPDGDSGGTVLADFLLIEDARPHDGVEARERHGALHSALSQLPPEQSYLLRARYFDELSDAAIGAALGVCRSEVYRRREAAASRLRRLLVKHWELCA